MEEIHFYKIDFSTVGVIQDKIIKGNVHFKDFEYHQANFENCVFDDIIFSSNSKRAKTYFSFTKCEIRRIDINCFVDHLCINDCKIHAIKQEKGETRFIEIFSDDKVNNINYLMLFNSDCNQLSIKHYNINHLSLQGLNTKTSLLIDNVTVFENFSIIGCLIKNGSILNVICKSNFVLDKFDLNTDLYLRYLDCRWIHLIDKLRNVNLILKDIKCKYLTLQNIEVINSLFKIENIVVSEELSLLESDFGNTFFVDCDFSKCRISISFPILNAIKSLNLKFSNNVANFNQNWEDTKEKLNTELIEFYRQLKVNAISQHNQYNSLYYYSKEMNCYYKSLKSLKELSKIIKFKNKKIHTIFKWLFEWMYDFYDLSIYSIIKRKSPFEGFRIWIFKYSNNFGIDWIRPTIIYLALSYFLFVIGSDEYDFTLKMKLEAFVDPNFPRFLNPISKFSFNDLNEGKRFISSFIDLIAIITQGFLIYQIIKGFRKFSF